MWLPKRLSTRPTSARDWYVLLVGLGDRVVRDLPCGESVWEVLQMSAVRVQREAEDA